MSNVTSFIWKGITFVVRINPKGLAEYRDALHLGGPWSEVNRTVVNPSIDIKFRHALSKAERELYIG